MSIESLKNAIPDYAKDIKLNLSSLLNEDVLTDQQKYGCFLATALAGRNHNVIQAVENECAKQLSENALNASKAAHSIMAMNNVYYKFTGMVSNETYKTMQAKLRMNVIANPGVEPVDFELWSLAVSVINGCKYCVDAHENKLQKEGISKESIQAAVRIAAVVHAVSCVLNGEEAMTADFAQAA